MLIGAPSVYESQPLSDGRKIGRACLISCCCFYLLTSWLWIVPSPVLCQVSSSLLSRALSYELCYSLMTFYTFMVLLQAWTRARGWELGVPAHPSPRFEQAIGGFILVPLLHAENDPSLACCLKAVVDKTFGLGFPRVYPCLFLWNGLIEPVSPLSSQDGCF